MNNMEERLQKILAQAGLGSRRDCEEYIVAGRVRVNGTVAEIGQKADPKTDGITLDGRAIKPAEQKVYIALHKPRYVLSTVDAEQGDSRQTVRSLVSVSERLYPVGRLDFESEGLVLMTNDGELAQRLTHPSHGHSKEYRVLLGRQPDAEQLATWQRGVVLEDGYRTQRAEVRTESLAGKGAWVRVVMREGRKRQIREIAAMLGLPVVRIVRVRIGNLLLGDLKSAEWRYLTPAEVKALQEDRPGLPPFPDMTRKSPIKARPVAPRRNAGRTPPPEGPGKPTGRTRPPASPSARRFGSDEANSSDNSSARPPASPNARRSSRPGANRSDNPSNNRSENPSANRPASPSARRPSRPGENRSDNSGSNRSEHPGANRPASPSARRPSRPGENRSDNPGSNRSENPGGNRSENPGAKRHSPKRPAGEKTRREPPPTGVRKSPVRKPR